MTPVMLLAMLGSVFLTAGLVGDILGVQWLRATGALGAALFLGFALLIDQQRQWRARSRERERSERGLFLERDPDSWASHLSDETFNDWPRKDAA